MLARWGLRTATDAGWGLQLQLQAWPVPNRRIQPQFCSRLFAFSRCLCVVACLFIVDREWERACWVVGRVVHASWRASSRRDCSGGILQAFSSMQLQALLTGQTFIRFKDSGMKSGGKMWIVPIPHKSPNNSRRKFRFNDDLPTRTDRF